MALAGVSDVYSKSNDLFYAFLGVDISESQVYRVTDLVGNQLINDIMEEITHPALADGQRVYASVDGSMVLTDSGWQEAKLGRIFSEDSRVENGTKGEGEIRYKLEKSTYSGHLGVYTDFIPKFEASLGNYKNCEEKLVFITDGAVWTVRRRDTELSNPKFPRFNTYSRSHRRPGIFMPLNTYPTSQSYISEINLNAVTG